MKIGFLDRVKEMNDEFRITKAADCLFDTKRGDFPTIDIFRRAVRSENKIDENDKHDSKKTMIISEKFFAPEEGAESTKQADLSLPSAFKPQFRT